MNFEFGLNDVVYYDRLVSPEIISLIRRDAARVPVGKSKGDHSVPQTEIHARLVASALEGLRVVAKGAPPPPPAPPAAPVR